MAEKRDRPEDRSDDPPQDLIEFMQASPLAEAIAAGEWIDATLERPRDLGREPVSFE